MLSQERAFQRERHVASCAGVEEQGEVERVGQRCGEVWTLGPFLSEQGATGGL